jgi:hypothetical protein
MSLGRFGREEDRRIAEKLRSAFRTWIDNGHSVFDDPDTVIPRVRLTDGALFSHGAGYGLEFGKR